MRILCERGRYPRICDGWRRAFEAAGHTFTMWSPDGKSAFDAFDEANPDLFIAAGNPTRAVSKCLAERKRLAVVEESSPQAAADTFLYNPDGYVNHQVKCDFVYIGTYREDKASLLNSYVLPLADEGYLKIFGTGPWPSPYYLGMIGDKMAANVLASATVRLNVSADGRTSDRVYNSILAGGVCVTNELKGNTVPGDLAIRGLTPEEFRGYATSLLSPKLDRWRDMVSRESRKFILDAHTYWHRCKAILLKAGFDREAHKLMEVYRATVRV